MVVVQESVEKMVVAIGWAVRAKVLVIGGDDAGQVVIAKMMR